MYFKKYACIGQKWEIEKKNRDNETMQKPGKFKEEKLKCEHKSIVNKSTIEKKNQGANK
jgi:hypothetical protein